MARFKRNPAGYVELMKSAPVVEDIHTKAEYVAGSAAARLKRSGHTWDNDDYYVNDRLTGDRAVSTVTAGNPDSIYAELKNHNLKRALHGH